MKKFGSKGAGRVDRGQSPAREAYGDPYQRVARPPRLREEGARGFTVTLDPDVARVFRGDAAVNKALRLVIQLMAVAAPRPYPPAAGRDRAQPPRRGYQGSEPARGFKRKPRFEEG